MTEFVAIVLMLAITYGTWLQFQVPTREQLRREYQDAQKRHAPSKDIHRKLVKATTDELRSQS